MQMFINLKSWSSARAARADGGSVCLARRQDGCHQQALSDALAHRRGAGRHRRGARQLSKKTGPNGTPTTRSKVRITWATRMRSSSCATKRSQAVLELEHMGLPFDRTPEGRISQRPFGGHTNNETGKPVRRACHAADRTGHMILQTLYQQCLKNKVNFFDEFQVLDF
jgi:hypothetical protein